MAKVYIAEFGAAGTGGGGGDLQISEMPPLREQTVSISGSSVQSAAFGAGTEFIRVQVDAICSIAIAESPTATTSKMRLAADQTEYFGVRSGLKLAVITNT